MLEGYVLILVCITTYFRSAYADCLNQKQEFGKCVLVAQCPSFKSYVTSPTPEKLDFLYNHACGYQALSPKICCTDDFLNVDRCTTPDTRYGRCMPFRNCASIVANVRNQRKPYPPKTIEYLKRQTCSMAGNTGHNICCPANVSQMVPQVELTNKFDVHVSTTRRAALPNNLLPPGYDPDAIVFPGEDVNNKFNNENKATTIATLSTPSLGSKTSLPKSDTCGIDAITDKIIGGQLADIADFPWMCILKYFNQKEATYDAKCGGSLINNRFVLTAAHCIVGRNIAKDTMRVVLGEYNTTSEKDCDDDVCNLPPLVLSPEALIPHPGWSTKDKNRENDIGLLKLAADVVYTEFIKPICLPLPEYSVDASLPHMTAGWGRTESKSYSEVKRKLGLPVTNHDTCKAFYAQKNILLSEKQICAGGVKGKDSCNGDSGGPLMAFKEHWFLVGIVSFGANFPCGLAGVPAVYTNVAKYITWISDNI